MESQYFELKRSWGIIVRWLFPFLSGRLVESSRNLPVFLISLFFLLAKVVYLTAFELRYSNFITNETRFY